MQKEELQKYMGDKIRKYRQERKMTQRELGQLLGLKHNTVSGVERGIASFDCNTIFKLANIFDVSADDFFPPLEREISPRDEYFELDINDEKFFEKLKKKSQTMNKKERAEFLRSVKFVSDYHDKIYGN